MATKDPFKIQLKSLFGTTIYNRGLDYYNQNKVGAIKLADSKGYNIKVIAKVNGSRVYQSEILFNINDLIFLNPDCNCPYGLGCKHSVAIGLAFTEIIKKYLEEKDYIPLPSMKEEKKAFLAWFEANHSTSPAGVSEKTDQNNGYLEDEDYTEAEDFYEDDNDFDGYSEYEDEDEDDDEEDDNEKDEEEKELLRKLRLIGIDPEKLPSKVLSQLRAGAKSASKKTTPVKKAKKIKFDINNYYLILNIDYDWNRISLNEKGRFCYGYYSHDVASEVLREFRNELSTAELKMFNMINSSGYEADFAGRFFELVKDTGIGFYMNSYYPRNKINFNLNPPKIKAGLLFKEGYNNYHDCQQNSFVYSLDGRYLNKSKFYPGSKHLIELIDKEINFHSAIPQILSNILSRIRTQQTRYRYYDQELLETRLNEKEILNINEIVKSSQENFDFETNIPDGFTVSESKTCEPKILIDYNSKETSLKVCPVVDYGFEKVNVSESVFHSSARYNAGFKRRSDYKFWGDYVVSVRDNNLKYARINQKKEIGLYKKIYESKGFYGFTKTGKCFLNSKAKINDFFNVYLPRIKELGYPLECINDKVDFETRDFTANINIDLNAENDWLYFDADCYCGDDKINLEDLIKLVKTDEDFLKLKNGKMLRIKNREELKKFVLMLQSFKAREEGGFEGRLYHAGELQNIVQSSDYYNSRIANSFNKFIKEAERGKLVKKVKLPPKLTGVMRSYQKDGIDWFYFLRKYGFAGVLADDMGLGKTLQTLALLNKEKKSDKPSIVVCPKSLIYNWQSEVEKFTPKVKATVIDGSPSLRTGLIEDCQKYDLLISSYFTLRNDFELYQKLGIKFNYLVIDEAQSIKNYKAKISQTVKQLDADYRLALTGTPLENNVSEIWSIFDFLMPGFLGTDKQFRQKYQLPIMKENSTEALDLLRRKIKPFMLRRLKNDVLTELPPKQEQASYCQLGDEQRILYQEVLSKVKSELYDTVQEKGFSKSQIHILAALTKLRQACNHPVLLLKDNNYKKYESAKLDLFFELVEEIAAGGRKVLVFSQFTKMLDILAKELKARKYDYAYLSGATKNRQDLVDDFNSDSGAKIFLISLRAGGTGLNLTSADNVIIFDPWWNPSVENQAIDRAHRIGQKKSVNVYRLITKGTIEEKIVELQQRKKMLFDNMVEASGTTFKKLTWNDIRGLLE